MMVCTWNDWIQNALVKDEISRQKKVLCAENCILFLFGNWALRSVYPIFFIEVHISNYIINCNTLMLSLLNNWQWKKFDLCPKILRLWSLWWQAYTYSYFIFNTAKLILKCISETIYLKAHISSFFSMF